MTSRGHEYGQSSRDQPALTIRTALRLPALRQGRPEVVAGADALDRRVRWVHLGEFPEIYIKGDELLLTLGMALTTPRVQRSFIRHVATNGAAGLILELGHVFDRVPAAMVTTAQEREFPLIALHREIHFVEATEAIHGAIASRELAIAHATRAFGDELTAVLLDGAGAPELLAALAERVENPVLLERDGSGVFFHATYRASDEDVIAAWEAMHPLTGDDVVVATVKADSEQDWGRLVALPINSPLGDFDRAAIQCASSLLAVALMRPHEDGLLLLRDRGNLLAGLASGKVDPQDAAARIDATEIQDGGPYLLPLAFAPRHPGESVDAAEWSAVWRQLADELRAGSISSVLGVRRAEGDALALLTVPNGGRRLAVAERVAEICRQACSRHVGDLEALVVAVGGVVCDWAEAPEALREVAAAARFGRMQAARPWLDSSQPDIDRWLWSMRAEPMLARLVRDRLGPLIEHDDKRAVKLFPTLQALLENGGHKAKTARDVDISRQSLYYRLQRIEQLLCCDLEDPSTRLELHLASRARALISARP
jgi:purine catabolism regulator